MRGETMAERDESGTAAYARGQDPTPATHMLTGKLCPVCGKRTLRERMPWWYRPVRWLVRGRISYRVCEDHCWEGLAWEQRGEFHGRHR